MSLLENMFLQKFKAIIIFTQFSAKCIALLLIITISMWLLEITTFYSPGPEAYLILMDMINGLQGVFILLIFVRKTIILRWWFDRGSHSVESVELAELNRPQPT